MTHLLIWAAFGLFFYRQLFFLNRRVPGVYGIKQKLTLGLLVTTFYFNSSVLVPRLLLRNHSAVYFVIIIAIVLSIAYINNWVENIFSYYEFNNGSLLRRSAQSPGGRLRPPGPVRR